MAAVIFLDIDGVLNTRHEWKIPFSINRECVCHFCNFINDSKRNPIIILTSSWKTGYSSLPAYETEQLKSLRKELSIYGIAISGRTRNLKNRMDEIQDYIHSHEVTSYAIIDDDPNEYSKADYGKITFIDAETGFSKKNIKNIRWNKV